ncbi:MAG: hypothetical protein ACR2J6_01790 [Thermoleophilaceae bacterium]
MDEFGLFVFFALVVVVGIFLAIGKWYPGSGAEQVDWRPTRSPELEVQLELDDVDQMIEAQNAPPRLRGAPDHRARRPRGRGARRAAAQGRGRALPRLGLRRDLSWRGS